MMASVCPPEPPGDGEQLPLAALIEAVCVAVEEGEAEFTRLDQAIGDGDHGANLRRGAAALRARSAELCGMNPAEALREGGVALVGSIGGAAGPLYGGFLLALGPAWTGQATAAEALEEALAAVRRRGRSDAGAKTLLDVLVPVVACLREGVGSDAIRQAADAGLEATRDMIATRGRAAYLGERSRGHYDPGAASARRFVHAICSAMETKR